MLEIRRTKQSTRKQLAGVAKRAKKIGQQKAKSAAGGAAKKSSP